MKTTKRLNDVIPNWSIGEGIFSALNVSRQNLILNITAISQEKKRFLH